MKQHINFKSLLTLAIISLLGISFIACNDKDEIEDEQLIAVKSLNVPTNDEQIVLQSVTDLLFEWSKSETKDVNIRFYSIKKMAIFQLLYIRLHRIMQGLIPISE